MQQDTAVGLDGELGMAVDTHVGLGLQAQVRRISMGPDDPEAGLGRRCSADLEGREAPAAHDIAAITGRDGPGLALFEARIACVLEAGDCGGDRVIGRGRTIDEREEIGDRVLHDAGA